MNNLASLFFPALIGLLAGIGHGVTSHHQDLPFSLTEQLVHSFQAEATWD